MGLRALYKGRFFQIGLLCLAAGLGSWVQGAARMACVGNSITAGYPKGSYVTPLDEMLGNEFEVRNFGVSGSTLLKKGDKPYWNQKEFKAALDFKPGIVTIMLGTNDSKPQNWESHGGKFRDDYIAMIDAFAALQPPPQILSVMPPHAEENEWRINGELIENEVIPLIQSVAGEKGIPVMDCHTPTLDRMALFPDGVHPNEAGNKLLAEVFNQGIQNLVLQKKPAEKLLWFGVAPGAKGDGSKDKPLLIVYPAAGAGNTGAAVIVCPGGSYRGLVMEKEGHTVAKWLNENGITAFVLRYRHSPYRHPIPLGDAKRAMRTVRYYAADYNLDTTSIGIMGFSAGGHLASTLLTHYDSGAPGSKDLLERKKSRPDFGILVYPVITLKGNYAHTGSRDNLLGSNPSPELVDSMCNHLWINSNTPPTFMAHGDADKKVPWQNSQMFDSALRANGVESSLIVEKGQDHGFRMQNGQWPDSCIKWLKSNNFLQRPSGNSPFLKRDRNKRLPRKRPLISRNGINSGFLPAGIYLLPGLPTSLKTEKKVFDARGRLMRR